MDDPNDPLQRLQILQRDLESFSEKSSQALGRLEAHLDVCAEDLRRILHRNRKNNESRAKLVPNTTPPPTTLTIDNVDYAVNEEFRQYALSTADALDLDEMEAAMLCIRSQRSAEGLKDGQALAMKAVLLFHEQRLAVLECLRLVFQFSLNETVEEDIQEGFKDVVKLLLGDTKGGRAEQAAYWRKCLEGLSDIEEFIAKVAAEKDKAIMTGEDLSGNKGTWLLGQRMFLKRQHESLASVVSYMIAGHWVLAEDYRSFLSKAAALEAPTDIVIHYLPALINGSVEFASDHNTTPEIASGLHSLYASGPGQLQWRNTSLKAAATVFWLAEYNARFTEGVGGYSQSAASQNRDEEARNKLFFDALNDKAFLFIVAAAAYWKPAVWRDPEREGVVKFLVPDALAIPAEAARPSENFAAMTMRDLQTFADALVSNMPDTLRKLKLDEDETRRDLFSQAMNVSDTDYNLERFMAIVAYAYQDDVEAAGDFWTDNGSNLYGFLKWTSQRLTTPRVACFCMLLQSIASDDTTANKAHRFLLEDAAMSSGKMRKNYALSWTQIFSELELYASSLKDRPSVPQTTATGQGGENNEMVLEEPETDIMLQTYLGLAASICRKSSEARNWLLREQTVHVGELMFQLLRGSNIPRVKSCCLELLTALLTDKSAEVRNGMWVLLDSWISSGGLDGSSAPIRPPGRPQYQAKHYLSTYATDVEAGSAMIAFLNALISPVADSPDQMVGQLPFPEALGRPHRHEGIQVYVDFVMDAVLARRIPLMHLDEPLLHVIRYECLDFAFQCLTSFNEDIVLLANTTNTELDSALETKSFARYASLHPFARVMEWLFDKRVAFSLFATLHQDLVALDDADPNSPLVQSTLKAIQVLQFAWKLQPTYFDLVRPAILSQTPKLQPISATWTSIDEMFLSHLGAVVDIASFTACKQIDISLECLSLLEKIGSSRKLSGTAEGRHGARTISVLGPISNSLTLQLSQDFKLQEWDFENNGEPLRIVKARALLKLLEASLKSSDRVPGMAHCLLGFQCRERIVEVMPGSSFDESQALFHAIVACAGLAQTITSSGATSWLLSLKRGCLEVTLKLATHPLTARIVQPILRAMGFLGAVSLNLPTASDTGLWDGKLLVDPEILISTSASCIRDFMRIHEAYFQYASTELRTAATQGSFSVQEKIVRVLLGIVKMPTGEEMPTRTAFELFDFFDMDTTDAFIVPVTKYFDDDNVSACTKEDPETVIAYDLGMANMYLLLRKKQLKDKGVIKEQSQDEVASEEIGAITKALLSQNNFAAIQSARLAALEAWTDLMSMVVTNGGMEEAGGVITFSLQGLLVTLPKFEKSLTDNMDAAALLAKLTLTFTHAIIPASQGSSEQTASVAIERLLSTFRVSLKVITDSSTDLALRDVAYRTCCAVMASIPDVPITGRNSQAASARQLLQLVQNAGERLLSVCTEDAFSGRGVTRVSALLFLDGLVSLSQSLKANTQILRGLMKLNFVPVLIDTGIGNVSSAFKSDDETIATVAYYHTAMALLLRLCKTSDGAQIVINSGLFAGIEESKLFSTDPDIGLDIENPAALKDFYAFLGDVVRLMTATVVQKGAQLAKAFLQQHRFTVQAILKQATRGQAVDVAEELCKLLMATDFLEDDQALPGSISTNGFS